MPLFRFPLVCCLTEPSNKPSCEEHKMINCALIICYISSFTLSKIVQLQSTLDFNSLKFMCNYLTLKRSILIEEPCFNVDGSIVTAAVLAVMYSLTNYQPLPDDFFRYGRCLGNQLLLHEYYTCNKIYTRKFN